MRTMTNNAQNSGPDAEPPRDEASIPAGSYRCPACGEMVDGNNAEQILLHHEHVTHPERFHFTFPAAA
jgi:hypothetical protein